MSDKVTIREVGPRDGLQNAATALSTATKQELIHRLTAAGLQRIEAGAFVGHRAVPLMADTSEVFAGLDRTAASYEALAVTAEGVHRAVAAGATTVAMAISASELFNRANTRMSIAQSIDQAAQAGPVLRKAGVRFAVTIATAFICPFTGPVDPDVVVRLVDQLRGLGAEEILLADTIGAADPRHVTRLLQRVGAGREPGLGLHAHNTRGMGLANVAAALDAGARLFDASIGGTGGCPFAPGASGNVATEDLVNMLHAMGYKTGLTLEPLIDTARWLEEKVGYQLSGHVMHAGPSWRRHPVPAVASAGERRTRA